MVSFEAQVFNLLKSKFFLSIFSFVTCVLGVLYKKTLPNSRPQRLIPMFSSKSFTVTVLVFRFMIHCELIFVYGVKKGFKLILLNVDIQLFQHYLLKRAILPH